MRHLVFCSLATLVAIGSAQQSSAVNLLADPSFESPFIDDGSGIGKWNPFADGSTGNTSEVGSLMPRTGASAAELNLVNANGFAGFFQDVGATAGGPIDFSVWAKDTSGMAGAGVEMRIEFRDSVAGTEVSRTDNLVPTLSTDYELVTLSETVPVGADSARVVFAIQSFGAGVPQTVFIDDAVATPEPTAALLALLGLAPLVRRR